MSLALLIMPDMTAVGAVSAVRVEDDHVKDDHCCRRGVGSKDCLTHENTEDI